MTGPMHKRLRSSFLDLFTRKALTVYVQAQDRIVRTWLATLKDSSSPQEVHAWRNTEVVEQLGRVGWHVVQGREAEQVGICGQVVVSGGGRGCCTFLQVDFVHNKLTVFPNAQMRDVMRMANLETSQTVFAGPYLGSKEEREAFSQAYLDMTEGFLAIPVCLPGTGV